VIYPDLLSLKNKWRKEMAPERVLEVIKIYRDRFIAEKIEPIANPHSTKPQSAKAMLRHCHSMLIEMEGFVNEGQMEKVFRWLGFIQGVLWAMKWYKISELRLHNLPVN
jgi:hypothetical protein